MLVQALLGISIHSWVSWPGLRKPCHAMPCLRSLEITRDHPGLHEICVWKIMAKILVPSLNLSPVSCPVFFLLGRSHWKIARNRNPRCCLFSSTVEHSLTLHLRGHRPGIPSRLPYINHPLAVARILAESGVRDLATLQAALLHDTLEDQIRGAGPGGCTVGTIVSGSIIATSLRPSLEQWLGVSIP